jgi:hypothetical protein
VRKRKLGDGEVGIASASGTNRSVGVNPDGDQPSGQRSRARNPLFPSARVAAGASR